jgi:hypothetical protein
MKCVQDVQQAALASPGILFYPASDKDKLINFAYSEIDPDNVMHLHSFQVTNHEAQKELMDAHGKVIHEANPNVRSSLYYMVLPNKFETVATDPVETVTTLTSVFYLAVPAA